LSALLDTAAGLALMCAMASSQALDVQGHRGARGLAPENTLQGFALALKLGVTTLEFDTGVTRDGVVVIHHDRRLNPDIARGPDGKWVAARGPLIRDLSYAELQRYDVGRIRPGSEYAAKFPDQRPADGARIPALSALFDLARPATEIKFNIETKVSPEAPDETLAPKPFARALVAEIRKAGVAARSTIQSFDWRTLAVVEREAPEIARVYLTSGENSVPKKVQRAGGRIWSPDFRDLTREKTAAAKALGLKIVVWTVNDPADIARMLELEVDGIISDYPDRVLDRTKRR
jgi:glycerophosphoryl diester phosphodiesterase